MLTAALICSTLVFANPPGSRPVEQAAQPEPAPKPVAAPPQSDARVPDLLARSVVIQSIDPEDDEDFSDLQPLKKLIGDSRLVVLGEQSHGDGAVFLAKARLIKFLHREMGFDVLSWESGMFDCREVDRALHDPEAKFDEMGRIGGKAGVFGIWTASAQVRPTLDFVRSTLAGERPIETCGFDHQFSAGESSTWAAATIAFFENADAALLPVETRESLTSGFAKMFERGPDNLPTAANVEPLKEKWSRIGALMDQHREALVKANGEEEFAFMRRCADDAVTSAQSLLEFIASRAAGVFKASDNNTRDQRMAANLVWQVNERYKHRKIIAWMATMHAVHDIQRIKPAGAMGPARDSMYDGVINCGTEAHNALGEKMYTIGFTAFDGKAGNVWGRSAPMQLPPPAKGSLEDLCGQTGKQFLFVDFRSQPADHWMREPIISRPFGYGEMTAVEGWAKQVDAMFYMRTMFPSTRENALPPYAVLREE